MDEFKYRESSSLLDNGRVQTSRAVVIAYFTSGSWICSCSVTHWSDSRIRALSILFYSSTTTSGARSRAERDHLERLVSRCQKSIESFTFLDLKLIRTRSTCFLFFWFEAHPSTGYLLLVLASAFLLDRIEMTWRITMIVTSASGRLELIETSAEIVANTSDWRLLLNSLSQWSFSLVRMSCLLRFRWYYDQFFVNLLHCRDLLDEK